MTLEEIIRPLTEYQGRYLIYYALTQDNSQTLKLAKVAGNTRIYWSKDKGFTGALEQVKSNDFMTEAIYLCARQNAGKALKTLISLATNCTSERVKLDAAKFTLNLAKERKVESSASTMDKYLKDG